MSNFEESLNKLTQNLNENYEELYQIIDDSVEDGDFPKVNSYLDKILSSKDPLMILIIPKILRDAMDTAYRGTKVDPPVKGCSMIVEFLFKLEVPVPNYPFHGKKLIQKE